MNAMLLNVSILFCSKSDADNLWPEINILGNLGDRIRTAYEEGVVDYNDNRLILSNLRPV